MQIPTGQEPRGQTNQDPHTGKHSTFYKNNIELPHLQVSALSSADRVLITFVTQKNGRKNNTTTQWRTNIKVLFPVVHGPPLFNISPTTPVQSKQLQYPPSGFTIASCMSQARSLNLELYTTVLPAVFLVSVFCRYQIWLGGRYFGRYY